MRMGVHFGSKFLSTKDFAKRKVAFMSRARLQGSRFNPKLASHDSAHQKANCMEPFDCTWRSLVDCFCRTTDPIQAGRQLGLSSLGFDEAPGHLVRLFHHDERATSALEQWLKRREPSFEPQWQHTSTQTYYVLGRACGTSGIPEVYQLRPILDGVVGKFSDERIADLVTILRQGSRDEQRQAIQRIADDYFDTK